MRTEKSTRRQRFERYAVKRVQAILENMDRLENCSNRNNYEYDESDVRKIFKAIRDKTNDIENEFNKALNKGKKSIFTL
jgi:hypothetical protein